MGVYAPLQSRSAGMNTQRIRELNDAFRSTFRGGRVVMTSSVDELPSMVKAEALHKAATFADFTQDNDPYGEHDFGSFDLVGRKFLWKIDYYDYDLQGGSEDPTDPQKTVRVLTLMLAEDY
jgi:hypothetical protein